MISHLFLTLNGITILLLHDDISNPVLVTHYFPSLEQ
jgi:hypothetical protein